MKFLTPILIVKRNSRVVIYGSFEDDPGEPDIEPTVEPKPENLCRWCNTVHGDSFFEKVVAWFHGVLATLFRR